MSNQNQAQPASDAAKRVIELWNAAGNSIFLTVDTEDGPNPPEIIVNVRSSEERYVETAKRDVSFLALLLETASLQRIPLAKNSDGEYTPTEEGQALLEESGKSSDVTSCLLMVLSMAFIDTKAIDEMSPEDLLTILQALSEATEQSVDDEPSEKLDIREKVIAKEDGRDVRHITINVLSSSDEKENELKALKEEFVRLHKAGQITVRLKPYTEEEIQAFQNHFSSGDAAE